MSGLPLVPLIGLGLLFFATPLIVLVLVLVLLTLRTRVRRLEVRLAEVEHRMRESTPSSASRPPVPESPAAHGPQPSPVTELELFENPPSHAVPAATVAAEASAAASAHGAI